MNLCSHILAVPKVSVYILTKAYVETFKAMAGWGVDEGREVCLAISMEGMKDEV